MMPLSSLQSLQLERNIKHKQRLLRLATRRVTWLKGPTYEQPFRKLSPPQLVVGQVRSYLLTDFQSFSSKLCVPVNLCF